MHLCDSTPLYGPFVLDAIKRLEAGEDLGRAILNPTEYAFDRDGGIVYNLAGDVSLKAADEIAKRLY